MTKSEQFAELLFNSSLDADTQEFILKNLDKFSEDEKNEIFEILKNDVKRTENILKLTKIKFETEKNKFDKESEKLELEFLKKKIEKNK